MKGLIFFLILLLQVSFVSGEESITLKSGRVVEGKIVERGSGYIKIDVQGIVMTFYEDEIKPAPVPAVEEKPVSDERMVKTILRTLSTAVETFIVANRRYPSAIEDLTNAIPPYVSKAYCGGIERGYNIVCQFSGTGYVFKAVPVSLANGAKIFSITNGGILQQGDPPKPRSGVPRAGKRRSTKSAFDVDEHSKTEICSVSEKLYREHLQNSPRRTLKQFDCKEKSVSKSEGTPGVFLCSCRADVIINDAKGREHKGMASFILRYYEVQDLWKLEVIGADKVFK